MAYRCALFLALIVLATTQLAHGQLSIQLDAVGTLSCTISAGNSTPVAGQAVTLECNNSTVGCAVTSANGSFSINAAATLQTLISVIAGDCSVSTTLPLANCTAYPTEGVLQAPTTLVQLIQGLFSTLIGVLSTGDFSLV